MKTLTEKELIEVLDDNGESNEGCIAIEFTMKELANKHTSTFCGIKGNKCFIKIAQYFHRRLVRGWYDSQDNSMCGMIHIQCTENEIERIEELAEVVHGSLRFNGKSLWNGFYEFEIE